MNPGAINKLRQAYLLKLYELSGGDINEAVEDESLLAALGIGEAEGNKLFSYLSKKGLVEGHTFGTTVITDRGIDEVERLMENQKEQVLKKLYKLANGHIEMISVSDLADSLGRSFDETYDDLRYWQERDLVKLSNNVDIEYESVELTKLGLHVIENPGGTTPAGSQSVTYNMNIGNNYGGAQQGGQSNTQNITLTHTNNPDFDRALTSIIELIRASNLPADEKQELEGEVASVNKLALKEPAPGLLDRAKSRFDLMRMGLQGADLLMKAGPHLDTAWEFLKHKFGGS